MRYTRHRQIHRQYGQCHRLSINRPTKRGKEKSPSDRHCQWEKEIYDHLMACQ
jgi:hypothetical protein